MANSTIYPYGTGGELPSNIGIINDLVTGGADKALSAQQGVVLKGLIDYATRDAPVNYTNGFSLGTNGATSGDPSSFISEPIPVSPGDVVYWHYGSASHAIRLVEYAADGTKIEYWSSIGSNARTITINNSNTAYIVAAFDAAQFSDSYVNVNDVRAYTPSDGEFCKGAEAWQLVNSLYGGEKYVKHIPTVEWSNDDYYINTSGGYDSHTGMSYSNVIPVPKGKTIVADMASGTLASAIALVDAAGTYIKTIAVGIGLAYFSRYSYTAEEDSYVVLSCQSQTTHPYIGYLLSASTDGGDVIYKGEFKGGGNSFVSASFQVDSGEYMRIWFPEGTWETRSGRESYNRLVIAINDAEGQELYATELCREAWPVPAYGFDFFVSPYIGTTPLECCIKIRAASGVTVPFVVERLSQDTPKSYFAPEFTDTVGKIRNLQSKKSLTLAVCTDLHYRDIGEGYRPFAQYSALGMMVNMREMAKVIRFDNILCLGDSIDGRWSAAQAARDAYDLMRFFGGIRVPLLYTLGNHDDNRYYSAQGGDRQLTAQEMFGYFVLPDDERAESDGSMSYCNWYRDIERHKIRIIAPIGITFNGSYGFTQDTQTWFAATFASMPQGYKALVVTHEPMVSAQGWNGAPNGASHMVDTISANIDKVVGVIFGHTHVDNVYLDPYVAVNIASAKAYGMESGGMDDAPEDAWFPERAAGDARENLWDVISLDQDNDILSCIRFGAGVDRHIHYTPIEVAAGNSVTLTPSIITATAWHVRASESSSISITSGGVVTVASGATVGARLTARAEDADGNYEYFIIKVV